MHTNHGPIELELFEQEAPKTVDNFQKLSRDGYYDGLIFHRVIPDFMIQGGCPHGTGTGGPGYEFEDEINEHKVARGALAMANRGPDTNGSQFFIVTTEAAPWLDGKHTVFGRVASGMEAVGAIEGLETGPGDRPVEDAKIERVEVLTDEQARRERFPGSPTIRINGEDIVAPSDAEPFSLTCRVYRTRDGRISAVPDPEDMREAVKRA